VSKKRRSCSNCGWKKECDVYQANNSYYRKTISDEVIAEICGDYFYDIMDDLRGKFFPSKIPPIIGWVQPLIGYGDRIMLEDISLNHIVIILREKREAGEMLSREEILDLVEAADEDYQVLP